MDDHSGAEPGATAASSLGILSQSDGHDFDRNFATEFSVLGPVHLPRTARAEAEISYAPSLRLKRAACG